MVASLVAPPAGFPELRGWGFVTSHARVLLAVAQEPELRVGEIAEAAGITERSAYRVLADLVRAGFVRRTRVGRCNHYELERDLPLGDPAVGKHTLRDLLTLLGAQPQDGFPGEEHPRG